MNQHLVSIQVDFESFLQASAPRIESPHKHFECAVWEMLKAGGKRFRPLLCLLVVDALNPNLLQNAFLPALSLEVMHTYSLIHDDLPCMDDAPLRRAKQTLHTIYGETLALLVGDGLNTYSFSLLADAKLSDKTKIELISELSNSAGIHGMVLGQVLDCEFENTDLDIDMLKLIHRNKTQKLISSSLAFGGIITESSTKMLANLRKIGDDMGLFFQIRDDIVDVLGSSTIEGKKLNADKKKNTYVKFFGIDGAIDEALKLQNEIYEDINKLDSKLQENLRAIFAPYGEILQKRRV